MIPTVYIAHQYKDRTRLRIPARRGNDAYFNHVGQLLAERDDVAYVETNFLTGSILLHHDASLDDLLHYAAERQLFALPTRTPAAVPVLEQASSNFDRLDCYIQHKTQGTLDLEGAVFTSLVIAAIVQIFRGQTLGPASALLSYAAAILVSHRSRRRSEERGVAMRDGQSG